MTENSMIEQDLGEDQLQAIFGAGDPCIACKDTIKAFEAHDHQTQRVQRINADPNISQPVKIQEVNKLVPLENAIVKAQNKAIQAHAQAGTPVCEGCIRPR